MGPTRMQVFTGAFIGYAAFYLVRKNCSMAIPFLDKFGIDKGELGTVLAMNAIAYALSKFLMGSVSGSCSPGASQDRTPG